MQRTHFLRQIFCLLASVVSIASLLQAAVVPCELFVRLKYAPRANRLDQVQTEIPSIDRLVLQGNATVATPFDVFVPAFPQMESVVALRLGSTVDLEALEQSLNADPAVEWVTRNHILHVEDNGGYVPNDSAFAQEWWLSRINAPLAWELTRGDTNIVFGIVDTGIDYMHPDIRPNLWHNWAEVNGLPGVDDDHNGFVDDSIGWDFVDAPTLPAGGDHLVRDSDPMDEMGHGTFVAGLCAGATDNQLCLASVGFHCRIMPIRAANSRGFLEEDDAAAAILYGAQMGARVINMSFGDVVSSPLLREACTIAHDAGVVLVASAGNDGVSSVHFPSGFPEVIAVGATDQVNHRANFSNYGPTVAVMAPGVEMFSAYIDWSDGGPYHSCGSLFTQGTSFAAPQVTGAVGLMLSVNPSLRPDEIKQIIRSTASDLQEPGWDSSTVSGMLNVRRAVEQARFGTNVFAQITSPRTEDGLSADFVVRGSAWGATFDHWNLSFGLGENPVEWTPVNQGRTRVDGDSLGTIHLPAMDTVMIVRLEAWGSEGSQSLDHTHILVQRSYPHFDSLRIRRMLDYDTYGDLVEVQTNQYSTASFLMTNAAGDSVRENFSYVSTNHAGFLSQITHPGHWTTRIQLINAAQFSSHSEPFEFFVSDPPFSSNQWARTETSLPYGFLGSFVTDYNRNGRPEVLLQPISSGGVLHDPLRIYEWDGQDFVATGNTYGIHFPRATGDANQNGLREMMASFVDRTIIWEQSDSLSPFNHIVFEDTINFIGAAFLDVDSTDHRGNIMAIMNVQLGRTIQPRYVIFSVDANYSLTAVDTLPNLTSGNNGLSQPKVLIGDLNQNGKLDFVYGDYDGDIVFSEYENGHPQQKWTTRLPLNDATTWLASGDLDGDGAPEIVAGCRSNQTAASESQIKSRHWEYYIFKRTAEYQFEVVDSVFILGNENVIDYPASVSVADINSDLRGEILISAYPDLYIISYDPATHRYKPRGYETPSQTNVLLAQAWNQDGQEGVLYSDGSHFSIVSAAGMAGQSPLPPAQFAGEPLNAHEIAFAWSPVSGAQHYRLYRRRNNEPFTMIAETVDTFFAASALPPDVVMTYAVTSVNAQLPHPESVYSGYLLLAANDPPTVNDTAIFIAPHFVEVRFSEAMSASALYQWNYRLADGRMPNVIDQGEGGRVSLLSFDGTFTPGNHALRLFNLRDAQGSRLPVRMLPVVFVVPFSAPRQPHVLSHRLIGGPDVVDIEIVFSDPMSESVLNADNYVMDTPHRVQSVTTQTAGRDRIFLHLDPHHPVGALGQDAWVHLVNLRSQTGLLLDSLQGAYLNLVQAGSSVDDAYVFPNPYRGTGPDGTACVFFAGLPEQATIRIFTVQGLFVRKLDHHDLRGAARWDLANENGKEVAGGVYLYTIESDGKTVHGKLAVLR